MNSLKNKLSNVKTNFSKNIVTSVIVPAVLVVLCVILAITLGFNKGIDFGGGILVSVKTESNLENAKEYSDFTKEVNEVLKENKVNASVYLVEKDSVTYDSVLVVKIDYNTKNAKTEELVESLKSDLVSAFYSTESAEQIELRHLVEVSTFGSSVASGQVVSAILATFVAVLLICVYVGFRQGMHSAVLTLLSSFISCVLAVAVIVIARIKINAPTLALMPLTAIISSLATFMFIAKTKKLLKTSKYERQNNYVLANDAVKENLYSTIVVLGLVALLALILGLLNISNSVVFLSFGIIACLIAIAYTNMFIIPAIFGLTFVRKVKREKTKKAKQTQNLSEEEVLKETDLDNLTSN
ncbi:MAG: hypothetical protein IJZ26_02400 [Clostridia bacterium]|nr:hypothetical protein [Clostridia bacterium]MBQ9786282.1 hypothetical protein [Clostridia bacterium]